MHPYTSKWAEPQIVSNSNKRLEQMWDAYNKLNLDAGLKLNAAKMKVVL